MKLPLTAKFAFGNVVVDPKSNAIYLNGAEKRIEPKLVNLLCLLAAQGREVISRQEIAAAIWSDMVVGEESITRAIFALRNALGDDAKQPHYIETIPKKGYRFLTDAHLIVEPDPVAEVESDNNVIPKPHWPLFFGVALVVLVLMLGIVWMRSAPPSIEIESLLPLNKMEGVERSLRLSDGGEQLLFVNDTGQANDLYSRDLAAGRDKLWIHDEFWKESPVWIDSNAVAYIRKYNNEFQVVRNYQGQQAQVVYSSSKAISHLTMVPGDTENLFFLAYQHNDLIELKSINLRTGEQRNWRDVIAGLPSKMNILQRGVQANNLLLVHDGNEKPGIIAVDLASHKVTTINDQFNKINSVSVADGGKLIVVGTLGVTQGIWSVGAQQQPRLVLRSSGSEEISEAQMDAKQKVIYYANLQRNSDLRLVRRDKSELNMTDLNSSGMELQGSFDNDGKHIYFTSNRTGFFDIWRYELASKSVRQISRLSAVLVDCFALSHDGKWMAISYRADNLYLAVVNVETGELQKRVKIPARRFPLAWSQDDTRLYVSEHEAEVNLFTYDVATLTQSLFAEKSGLYVKDIQGERLIYVDYVRNALVERTLATGDERTLTNAIPNLADLVPHMLKVNKNNDGIYAACDMGLKKKICWYPFANGNSAPSSGEPVAVMDTSDLWVSDIAEDGESTLLVESNPPSGDMMKMQLVQ